MDEEVHLLFMRGTHQLGRTADAMRVARHFRQRIVEARVGDLERAQGFIADAEPWVEALWAQGGWRAALDEARGHVAGASGDHLTARTLLQAAAERFASVEQPLDAARCLAALADSERLG